MSKQGLFKNSDGLVEFYQDKIDEQVLEETYRLVSRKIKFGDIIWPMHMPKNAQTKKLVDKIEKKLVQNNNEYCRFSSDYVHCKLSYDVYNDKLKRGDTLESDKNWKVIETFALPNDESSSKRGSMYFAALYYNKYKGQSILAHRGIEAKASDFFKKESTLVNNLSGILLHEYVPQLVKCYEVTERCYRIAKQLRCTLSFTGFSNGAWLAENCIYFCEKYIKADYVFDFEDFFEVETKAVLFESPGIFRSKNEYKSNIISNEYDFEDIKGLNIVNYLLSPNLMNSINLHVGLVYRLFMDEKDQIDLKNREFLQKFVNIPLIGKKISEYSVEVRYLFNGLNSMFNCSVLKKILDSCFDPVTESAKSYCQMLSWPLIKIDFYKNIKENLKDLVDKTFENLLEMIPFLNQIEIVSKPIQLVTRKITAKLTQSLMEGFTPAIHVLICVMIEYFKDNLDLKFCNNSLFFKREDEINQIVVNNEYIKKNYASSQKQKSTSTDKNLERKIEEKFSLFYNSNYIPVRKRKVESLLLNLSDDYSRNVDWILYHLKRGSHYKNVKSKIVRNHLASLRDFYEIENVNVKEKVIYVIRIRNEQFHFEKLRESILRILSISREDIREIIFRNNSITNLNFAHNLGIRRAFVRRKNILEELTELFYENSVIYLYGKPGTGKSLLAKEFGFRFLQSGRVRFFESEDKFQFLNSYHKFLLNFLDEYTTDFRSVDYDKLSEIACVKLLQQESLVLFIFDNVELFDAIQKEVCDFMHNEKIKILITTRNKDFNRTFKSIEVKFFDKKEAIDYVNLHNEEALINKEIKNSIISKIGIKNEQNEIEILPKTLEINIKYLLENYITDDLKNLLNRDDFQIFEYVFRTLDPDQTEMLKYFSFMNPKRINVLIVKDICQMESKTERSSKITDCIMKLSNIGIIDVHKKEKCLSMHRLIRNEIKKIFDTVNEKKQYLNKLIEFILKNLKENIEANNEDLNDEFLEHLYEIVKENFAYIKNVLKMINSFLTTTLSDKKIFELILKISQEIHNILVLSNGIDKSLVDCSISNLGICNFYLEKINESVNLLNRAADQPGDNFQRAQSLYFLAKCYTQLNNDEKGVDFFQKSFDMYKRLYKNKIAERPILCDCLNYMAGCYLKLNKLEKAIDVYLEIEAHFGKNKDMYKCMFNLAHCYFNLDSVDKALICYKKSLRILDEKEINEKDESELAKISNSIGFCLSKKSQFKESLAFYEKAYDFQLNAVNYDVDTDTDKTNIELSSYLNNIGVCHLKLEDYKNALHYCEQAIKMRKLVDENDHLDLVVSLKNLALCYYKNGQETESDKYYQEGELILNSLKNK